MTDMFDKFGAAGRADDGVIELDDWGSVTGYDALGEQVSGEMVGAQGVMRATEDMLPAGVAEDLALAAVGSRSSRDPFFFTLLSGLGFLTGPFIRYVSTYTEGFETPLGTFSLIAGIPGQNKSSPVKRILGVLTKFAGSKNRSKDIRDSAFKVTKASLDRADRPPLPVRSGTPTKKPNYQMGAEDMWDGQEPDNPTGRTAQQGSVS